MDERGDVPAGWLQLEGYYVSSPGFPLLQKYYGTFARNILEAGFW
jgi:hypothetical protein